MKHFRGICLLWHRYVGLGMALFLTIAGLTGSVLAFRHEIERRVAPQLFAKPQPGVPTLDLATLAERAPLLPHANIAGVSLNEPDQASIFYTPKKNPATGRPYDLGFKEFFVNPWTGKELGRRTPDKFSEGSVNLMSIVLHIHDKLFLGGGGTLFMGLVALLWTIDCFVAFYLTFPPVTRGFWRHWKPSWLIKRNASTYRLNLDLHRSFSLWLWPVLFVFAWSSVMFNLRFPVYDFVTRAVFDYHSPIQDFIKLRVQKPQTPTLEDIDWRKAIATGRRLMEEEAGKGGFKPGDPSGIAYVPYLGAYTYLTNSRVDPMRKALLMFDPKTERVLVYQNTKELRTGNVVELWLSKLHTAEGLGLPYKIFVALLGFVIAMLSATGVYLWWKKRSVRRENRTETLELTNARV